MSDPAAPDNAARGSGLGIALVALGLAAGAAALGIGGWGEGAWGPRTVPLLAATTLAAAGVAVATASTRRGSTRHGTTAHPPAAVEGEAPDGASPDSPSAAPAAALRLLGLAVLYVLAIDRVGYLLATALAAPAAFWLFGARRPVTLLLVATVLPLALHVAFFRLLGVFPPFGQWFDLLDVVPL